LNPAKLAAAFQVQGVVRRLVDPARREKGGGKEERREKKGRGEKNRLRPPTFSFASPAPLLAFAEIALCPCDLAEASQIYRIIATRNLLPGIKVLVTFLLYKSRLQ
jgi:hypothetical protein